VTVVPGPRTAAGASGLDADRFVFEGFLPKKPSKRRKILESLSREPRTLIFYESPHRVAATLEAIRETLGDRRITIARELTKMFEEIRPTTVSATIADLEKRPPRGEYVLVVAGRVRGSRRSAGVEE
jgi:16S rRNA (cytidine1402-2'-O)-methyltransferase